MIHKRTFETPTGKLINALMAQCEAALKCLQKGKPASHAITELEYVRVIIEDTFRQYPELAKSFYTTEKPVSAICPKCDNYLPGHATGSLDICTCYANGGGK
jgi:hypothetical protein